MTSSAVAHVTPGSDHGGVAIGPDVPAPLDPAIIASLERAGIPVSRAHDALAMMPSLGSLDEAARMLLHAAGAGQTAPATGRPDAFPYWCRRPEPIAGMVAAIAGVPALIAWIMSGAGPVQTVAAIGSVTIAAAIAWAAAMVADGPRRSAMEAAEDRDGQASEVARLALRAEEERRQREHAAATAAEAKAAAAARDAEIAAGIGAALVAFDGWMMARLADLARVQRACGMVRATWASSSDPQMRAAIDPGNEHGRDVYDTIRRMTPAGVRSLLACDPDAHGILDRAFAAVGHHLPGDAGGTKLLLGSLDGVLLRANGIVDGDRDVLVAARRQWTSHAGCPAHVAIAAWERWKPTTPIAWSEPVAPDRTDAVDDDIDAMQGQGRRSRRRR